MSRSSHPSRRPIGLAKLTPPRLPPVVERRRLFRLLDQARKRPIVWIAGPPGAGKTTLVGSYLRTRKLRSLWYQVDEGDADPATFFHYLGLAGQKAAPRTRRLLPHLTPEYLPGLPTFTRRFFQELFRRLAQPAVVVLDNYQEVAADSRFHEILAWGLAEAPENLTVLMLSRALPPPALAQLQAAQAVSLFDEEALRLTEAETRAIVRLHMRGLRNRLARVAVQPLHQKLRGWVAGLVLMLEQTTVAATRREFVPGDVPEVVFEYLAKEVLKKLNAETQGFLMKTAVFSSFTASMAERLTGVATAGDILATLHRARYFTDRRQGAEASYQYHPLFREFLLAQAKQDLRREQLAAVRQTAAALLEEAGRIEDAFALFQDARAIPEQVRMILTHARTFMAQGRMQTLDQWIGHLPPEVIDNDPWLLFWRGSCRLGPNPAEAFRLFDAALVRFKAHGDPVGVWLAWSMVIEAGCFAWDDFSKLDSYLDDQAAPPLSQLDGLPPELRVQIISGMLKGYSWRKPQDPTAPQLLGYATRQMTIAEDPVQLAALGLHLVTVLTWFGEVQDADHIFRLLKSKANFDSAPPLARVLFAACEAVWAWWMGQAETAYQALCRGQAISRDSGVHVMDGPLEALKVYILLLAGNVDEAEAVNRGEWATYQHKHGRGFDSIVWHYRRAYAARLRGNFDQAWSELSEVVDRAKKVSSPFWTAQWLGALAEVAHARGNLKEAQRVLTQAREAAQGIPSKLLEFQFHLAEALFALDDGKERAAFDALRRALAIGRAQRLVDTTWWIPPVMARLCAKALEAGIETEYAQFLIRKRKLPPPAPAPAAWPWPIRITTLGGFQVLVDDQPPRVGRKTPRRLLTLLKALVAGNHAVSRDRLLDALWPEADGDVATAALHTTMARLRKLLHSDGAIELREGTVTLDPQACYVDVWTFERLLAEAEAARQAGDHRRWAGLSEQAFHLYHGPFLADDLDQPWSHPQRDRFRCKFAHLVDDLTGHWRQTGHPELAVKCRERAAEVDPEVRAFLRTG